MAKHKKSRPKKIFFKETLFASFILFVSSLNLINYLNKVKKPQTNSPYEPEFVFWEEVNNKYPTYQKSYLELARLNTLLGDKEKANDFLKKGFSSNPNYEAGSFVSP